MEISKKYKEVVDFLEDKAILELYLYFDMLGSVVLITKKENVENIDKTAIDATNKLLKDKLLKLKRIEVDDIIDASGSCFWLSLSEGKLSRVLDNIVGRPNRHMYRVDNIIEYKDLGVTFYWLANNYKKKKVRGLIFVNKLNTYFLINSYKLKKRLSPKDLIIKIIYSKEFKEMLRKQKEMEEKGMDFWEYMLSTPEGRKEISERFYGGIPIITEEEEEELRRNDELMEEESGKNG